MFKVTPIGSCRIYAPLRECTAEYGFQINLGRVFGYAHTSAEAVQQMHSFSDDYEQDEKLWPLIARHKDLNLYQAQTHKKSDLYIIELSSAKVVTIGNQCLQLNYLNAFFKDFFSDKQRAASFSRICRLGDPARVEEFLKEVWCATPEQREDTETLKQIKITMSTEQSIYEDICQLKDGLENIIFVTHANAKDVQDRALVARKEYISRVVAAAERAGARLYNPSDLMEVVGQENAIEEQSANFAHFTKDFSRKIFADWYDTFFKNMIEEALLEATDMNIEGILVPHAHALLETGDPERIDELSDLLDAVELHYPANISINRMRRDVKFFNENTTNNSHARHEAVQNRK